MSWFSSALQVGLAEIWTKEGEQQYQNINDKEANRN